MHKPESRLENETHKILWDFKIQTGHLISTKRPDLVIIDTKQRTCRIVSGLCCPGGPQSENKRKQKERQILGPCQRTKIKLWNMKVTVIPIISGALGTAHKGMETRRIGNKRTNREHPSYSIAKIVHNTEKSPGDMRRIPLTQTLVEDHQLKLV